ncbi:MAG: hypothetical protein KA340_12960 [Saprospiraceae bacterium]|nr:hypothetical protein [Saprospiraceae bacterium]
MESYFEKIKEDKIKEATELFNKIKIAPTHLEEDVFFEIPIYDENNNPVKEEVKLHWTRLSINSTIGCVIE